MILSLRPPELSRAMESLSLVGLLNMWAEACGGNSASLNILSSDLVNVIERFP